MLFYLIALYIFIYHLGDHFCMRGFVFKVTTLVEEQQAVIIFLEYDHQKVLVSLIYRIFLQNSLSSIYVILEKLKNRMSKNIVDGPTSVTRNIHVCNFLSILVYSLNKVYQSWQIAYKNIVAAKLKYHLQISAI